MFRLVTLDKGLGVLLALTIALTALWLATGLLRGTPPTGTEAAVVTPSVVGALVTPAAAQVPVSHAAQLPPGQTQRVTVLTYHHIGPVPAGARGLLKDLTVSAQQFAKNLDALQQSGCRVLTMAQVYDAIANGKLPAHPVVLTFDDGYRDNYDIAWPLLEKHGFIGTFCLVSDYVGATGHMTRDQVRQLAQAGNEIASHTRTHPDLRRVDAQRLQNEVEGSRRQLEAIIEQPVITFCYPSGKYDDKVLAAVRAAGYKLAMTTESGNRLETDRPLQVKRYRVKEQTDVRRLIGH